MRPSSLVFIAVGMVMLSACSRKNSRQDLEMPDALASHRDTTINPGTDFFAYANGGWFGKNPIPASETSNGIFRIINDTIQNQIRLICERAAAASAPPGSNKQKIGDFFASGMDTVTIEKLGVGPLKGELDRIEGITNVKTLTAAIAHLQTIGVPVAFSYYVGQDDKISSKHAIFIGQPRLALGDRDYYLQTDARTVNIRKAYTPHIKNLLVFAGETAAHATADAAAIMALETSMAKASRALEALRDPEKNYNKMSIAQATKLSPNFPWDAQLQAMTIAQPDTIIVGQPEYLQALNSLLSRHALGDWKAYLKWNLLHTFAFCLNKDIQQESFHFFSTVLRGVEKQRPRWKRVVVQTDQYLGELIGEVYVNDYLPKGTKEKLLEIGNNVREVYAERIKDNVWMSDTTKQKALAKLNAVTMKMGYPDKWKDLSKLSIDRLSYCANVMRANEWDFQYMTAKFGKPVDRLEWGMYPQTYNAYYNPSNNEIAVPACNILVPGYEGKLPDDAVLYGIIGGSTIGHEFTHGFDDQGSQYDQNGNLKGWWTAKDRERFMARTKVIVDQYNQYVVVDSLHINGDATQGENIADLGGALLGWEAFKKTSDFKENKMIGGLTPAQRYFLSFAYSWMVATRDESLADMVMNDVHSPPRFRIVGPLSNIPDFYEAFGIKPTDAMYRPDSLRVTIW